MITIRKACFRSNLGGTLTSHHPTLESSKGRSCYASCYGKCPIAAVFSMKRRAGAFCWLDREIPVNASPQSLDVIPGMSLGTQQRIEACVGIAAIVGVIRDER